jgi:protein pelota
MKLLWRSLREGRIKVVPESLDDLWYLKGVIREGDIVAGKTARRVRDEERLRADKGERLQMRLSLRVEGVEFHPSITRLRITGRIIEGPEDLVSLGSYHTLDIKPGDAVTITKEEWRRWELMRIKEAEKASKAPLVLIVALEEAEAEFALVRRYGVEYLLRVTASISGKGAGAEEHASALRNFYANVAARLKEIRKREGVKAVILCGPGFAKEGLLSYLREKDPATAELCTLEGAGAGGRAGVQEAIKRGAVDRVAKESRVSLETRLVEQVFVEIGKSTGLAAYGHAEVESALELGAVEKLLISEELLRRDERVEELMEKARRTRGEVVVVSKEHEAGERLLALGGIAALLRFRV